MSTFLPPSTLRRLRPWVYRCCALLLACAPIGAAWAHAFVIASRPAANGTVTAGPTAVDLQFNSRIDRARARLVLVGPDDTRHELVIAEDPRPDHLGADAGTLAPGAYRVEWYALSPDGHVTRGSVPFAVGQH